MDLLQCQMLSKHVEELTTNGRPTLDQTILKNLKKICKKSDEYVKETFHLVMTQLRKEHAEIRLSAFLIIDELFNRSHCFRELLLAEFQEFLELASGIDPYFPLPAPKNTANLLQTKTFEAINQWNNKFGKAYKKLSLGFNYLKNCKKVDFQDIHALTVGQRRRQEEIRQHQLNFQKEKLEKTLNEMHETRIEIENVMTQMENCLQLLLPNPDEFSLSNFESPDDLLNNETSTKNKGAKRKNSEESNTKGIDSKMGVTVKNEIISDESDCSSHNYSEKSSKTVKTQRESKHADTSLHKNRQKTAKTKPVEVLGVTIKEEPVSDVEDEDDDFEEVEDSSGQQSLMQHHGLGTQGYGLSIDMSQIGFQVEETEDNTDILHTLKDLHRLIENKFLKAIASWLEVFPKVGAEESHIKKAIDMKQKLIKVKSKVETIQVKKLTRPQSPVVQRLQSLEDEDDEFESVPEKEGFEPRIPDHLRKEYGLDDERPVKQSTSTEWRPGQNSHLNDKDDPTTWEANIAAKKHKLRQIIRSEDSSASLSGFSNNTGIGPSTSKDIVLSSAPSDTKRASKNFGASTSGLSVNTGVRPSTSKDPEPLSPNSAKTRSEMLEVAPHVPFSMDLFNWGKKIEAPSAMKGNFDLGFWTQKDKELVIDKSALDGLQSRMINYTGDFKPVEWKCRAPLSNGTLCPRMDRVKCPFHGKIIPRDNIGNPSDAKDRESLLRQKIKKEKEVAGSHWEDPELQADIEAATGVKLTRVKGRGKKGGKQKYPNLTNLKKSSNPKTRLEKKIFTRNAMKRVASAMDSIDSKRFKDKFANSFHYAIRNTPG